MQDAVYHSLMHTDATIAVLSGRGSGNRFLHCRDAGDNVARCHTLSLHSRIVQMWRLQNTVSSIHGIPAMFTLHRGGAFPLATPASCPTKQPKHLTQAIVACEDLMTHLDHICSAGAVFINCHVMQVQAVHAWNLEYGFMRGLAGLSQQALKSMRAALSSVQ